MGTCCGALAPSAQDASRPAAVAGSPACRPKRRIKVFCRPVSWTVTGCGGGGRSAESNVSSTRLSIPPPTDPHAHPPIHRSCTPRPAQHTHTRARARASASALRGDAETRQPSLLMTATPAPGDEAAVVLLLASPRGHAFCLAARPFFSLRRPATLFASPPRALVCLAVRDWRLAGGVVPPKRRPVPRRLSRSLGAGRSLAANSHPGAACPARRRRTCRWCTCCPQPARSTRSE